MGNFLTKIKLKIVLMTAAVGIVLSSCYSFTGSSLSPETKTILIKNFPNNAALVNSDLSQDFTMALQNMFLQRTELLIGSNNIEKLKNSNVIVFGLGGVGGATVEALVRAGIGNLSIVDFDTVDKTNLNRQIITTQSVIGKPKVEVAKDRILSINPDINLTIYNEKFLKENINLFFKDKKYDYIVDAIDLVTPKLDLIEFATNSKIPIISCMGTGNKINPAQFKVADIKKTSVCPLAKIIRKELKKRRINKLKVVYSDETPRKPLNLDGGREKNKNVGSISFVPPVAGMLLASEVIKDICKL